MVKKLGRISKFFKGSWRLYILKIYLGFLKSESFQCQKSCEISAFNSTNTSYVSEFSLALIEYALS